MRGVGILNAGEGWHEQAKDGQSQSGEPGGNAHVRGTGPITGQIAGQITRQRVSPSKGSCFCIVGWGNQGRQLRKVNPDGAYGTWAQGWVDSRKFPLSAKNCSWGIGEY